MKARTFKTRELRKFSIGDKMECIRPIDGLKIGWQNTITSENKTMAGVVFILANGFSYYEESMKMFFKKI